MNPECKRIFPRIPFLKLMSEFEKPQMSEGFARVINLGFQVPEIPVSLPQSRRAKTKSTNSGWEMMKSFRFGAGSGFENSDGRLTQSYISNGPSIRYVLLSGTLLCLIQPSRSLLENCLPMQQSWKCSSRIFKIVNRWNAILLLGEAGVFLQQRTPSDLVRNGLVSVFLYKMEYYKGIVFLTINRVA